MTVTTVRPIFEVFNRDHSKHFKIYEDGGIKGFGNDMCIINRIPNRMNHELAKLRLEMDKQNDRNNSSN